MSCTKTTTLLSLLFSLHIPSVIAQSFGVPHGIIEYKFTEGSQQLLTAHKYAYTAHVRIDWDLKKAYATDLDFQSNPVEELKANFFTIGQRSCLELTDLIFCDYWYNHPGELLGREGVVTPIPQWLTQLSDSPQYGEHVQFSQMSGDFRDPAGSLCGPDCTVHVDLNIPLVTYVNAAFPVHHYDFVYTSPFTALLERRQGVETFYSGFKFTEPCSAHECARHTIRYIDANTMLFDTIKLTRVTVAKD